MKNRYFKRFLFVLREAVADFVADCLIVTTSPYVTFFLNVTFKSIYLELRGKAKNENVTFTDVRRQMEGEQKCKIRNKKLEQYFNIDFSKEALQKQFDKNAMAADQEAEALEKVNLSRNDCRAICEYVRFTFTAMAEEGLREIPCEELANQVIQHTDAPPLMQDKIRTFLQRSNLMQEKQSTGEVLPVGSGPGPRRTIMQLFLRNLEEEAETMRVRQPARQRNRGFELD